MQGKKMLLISILSTLSFFSYTLGCQDSSPKAVCENFRKSGYCQKMDWVKKQCEATCGICDPNCFDRYRKLYCVSLQVFCSTSGRVSRRCRKTCGKCVPTTPSSATTTTLPPTTTTTPLSPTTTEKTTGISVCEDNRPWVECDNFKRSGLCTNNTFVRNNCRAMCEICGRDLEVLPPHSKKEMIVKCGYQKLANNRVIAGQKSVTGQWPWQIALYKNGRFACGGSLITPEWIVTAAHCLKYFGSKKPSYRVVLGDLNRNDSTGTEQTMNVAKDIQHPQYMGLDYDIALLKLERPAILTDHVQTVCLPHQYETVPVGTQCYISGWGKVVHPGGSVNDLQHARMKIISNNECQKANSKITPVTDRMVCARNDFPSRQSGCHGDSGGPFVCPQLDGSWKLHGAVSWGSRSCNVTDANSVFARMSVFRGWVDEQIRLN